MSGGIPIACGLEAPSCATATELSESGPARLQRGHTAAFLGSR
jgi:hypothetical protein